MKEPYLQFYTGDFLRDPGVRSVSLAARGLWIDMLCLMHQSARRGYLQHPTGLPFTPVQLARMVGHSVEEIASLLQELEDSGVFSRTKDGVIFSRRMDRDERKRQLCSEAGKRGGGNPALTAPLKATYKGTLKGGSKGGPKGGVIPQNQSQKSEEGIHTQRAREPDPDLPQTAEAAVAAVQLSGIPPDFARRVFVQMSGVGWIDGAGRPVENWPFFLAHRWALEQDQLGRQKAQGQPLNGRHGFSTGRDA